MKKTFYIGPPGTGKTESLIRKVEELMKQGVDPKEIAYISFTNIAADEAKNRAIKAFPNVPEKKFENFKTLHSLCYAYVPELRDNLMTDADYASMGAVIPVNYHDFKKGIVWETPTDKEGNLKTSNPYLRTIQVATVKKIPVMEYFNNEQLDFKIKRSILEKINEEYARYKKENYLYDYNDFLIKFCELPPGVTPQFKILIVDECQDLSALQWDCIKKMIAESGLEEVYFAGDDDQAIYEWAGADVNQFRSLVHQCDEVIELQSSHRVPKGPHALAEKIIKKDKGRVKKMYLPKQEGTSTIDVKWTFDECIPLIKEWSKKNESVLVLCSFKKPLMSAEISLRHAGLRFDSFKSSGLKESLVEVITTWERWNKSGKTLSGAQIKELYKYLETGTAVKRGYKTGAKAPDDLEEYTIEQCMENFGLLVRGPWYDCIAKISDEDRQYMKQIEDSGRQLTDPALIRVSTISTIKGAEADHVILFSDIAYPEVLQLRRGGGEVHRKQYVAVTRTKETLHIILAKNFENSYPLLSLWQDLEKEQIKMEEIMYEKTRSSEFSLPL
tara:strand:+ start:300 stop:1970 length:1671 start_codon:yes stop_codon:yes gene_type:complete